VDVLTGGASAVYGSDAVSGVLNFILDTDFEGVSANFGYSGYQHKNNNRYMQGLMDQKGYEYPTGNSGLDGITRNFDLAFGGKFAEGRGHAMGWVTWRENKELLQAARDYSSCALDNTGTECGGSGTSINPTFIVTRRIMDMDGNPLYNLNADGTRAVNDAGAETQRVRGPNYHINTDNTWGDGAANPYNFGPINHYQRPDKRVTFGSSIKYEINEHFKPYMDAMFATTSTKTQIAESGTFFFHTLTMTCADPLLRTFCEDTDNPFQIRHGATVDANGNEIQAPLIDARFDLSQPMQVRVGKRNVEGGPRISNRKANNFRIVLGTEGAINDFWSYNLAGVYGRNSTTSFGINDFLADRVQPAMLGCPPGSYSGCIPYNVWEYEGVTPEQASGLAGTSMSNVVSTIAVLNGYVTGAFDWGLPTAKGESIGFVVGAEHRRETFDAQRDSNSQIGNFTGAGGRSPPISGAISVDELFMESQVPLLMDDSGRNNLYLDLGYRHSDYDRSGTANTYKIGFAGTVAQNYRLRGGYNRAIRAPGTNDLFSEQRISLWGGDDPCAPDANGNVRFTQAQCANTGLLPSQYGQEFLRNPSVQNNQFGGGNPDLKPEQADTRTLGFVATPIMNLSLAIDWYDVKVKDRIGTIGAATILEFCGLTGDPFLCEKVHRSAAGDLWLGSDQAVSGYVENLTANFGEIHFSGIDLSANYRWGMWGGWMSASFTGSHVTKAEYNPLPGVNEEAKYDCAGIINPICRQPQTPDWKHILNLRYAGDAFTVGVRWRHIGALDYKNQNGTPGTTDRLLVGNGNKLSAMNYLDLSGSYALTDKIELSGGVNNIADKTPPLVGNSISLNANAPGGYDQIGRYLFANLNIRF